MKYKKVAILTVLIAHSALLSVLDALAQERIELPTRDALFCGLTPPTPIAISGFSPEVENILRFDLTVMGFTNVPPDSVHYLLQGTQGANVQGQLSFGKSVIFSKVYNGASTRAQAHRLADDVVLKVTGLNGIAETRIAFKAEKGRDSEIYIADFDGHNDGAVTTDRTLVAAPCWVPGRLALYYTSYKLGNPDIFYQNLSTGSRHNFSHFNGMNSSAAVSPDGRRVAMILSKSGSPHVYVCDADGSNLKQLTTSGEYDSSPCWSPNGQSICFASRVAGARGLFVVSAGGGAPRRIHTSGISNPSEPDWSPDGKWIAFTAQMSDFNLCVVPAEGGTATLITSGEDPSWAPNSRTLIFVRRHGGSSWLSLLDVPTKQVKDVSRVSGSTANSQPSWAR
jgi:TolB protein